MLGANAVFSLTNVSDEASAQACVALALSRFGGLHGLVNCAGVGPAEKVLGKNGVHALASFSRTININVIGTFNMLRLAAEAMSAQDAGTTGERGVIINTASVAAFDGQIGQAGYSASKGAVVAMTLPIARELARFGIRVMTIGIATGSTGFIGQDGAVSAAPRAACGVRGVGAAHYRK